MTLSDMVVAGCFLRCFSWLLGCSEQGCKRTEIVIAVKLPKNIKKFPKNWKVFKNSRSFWKFNRKFPFANLALGGCQRVVSSGVLLCGCQEVAKVLWVVARKLYLLGCCYVVARRLRLLGCCYVVARRLLRWSGWLSGVCFFWGVAMWLPGGC